MTSKGFSRISALAICFCMLFGMISYAADGNTYSPGPRTYELDRGYFLSAQNASLDGDDIVINNGGEILFDMLLPFDSDSLAIKYKTSSFCMLKLTTDKKTYTTFLMPNESTKTITVDEYYGSNTFKIESTGDITITGIEFNKIYESFHANNGLITDMTDYEDALLTSVVFKLGAGVVKSKGAIRRMDYSNLSLAPQLMYGSMYVPVKVISAELGLYCEDYPDKSYILVRGESTDLELVAGKGTFNDDLEGIKEVALDVVYSDGITWVPLRKFSETMGFYVEYRDGYAVIDDRLCAKKVVEDAKIFSTLCQEFEPYSTDKVNYGKTYHVAVNNPEASDANSGTEQYPFKTLKKAGQVAMAGDTVIIHEGTYREVLRPQNNGTEMSPITFRAADGENVVISALEPLKNIHEYKNNIYCASVPVNLGDGRNQIFYKGNALTEGRHPNTHTKVEVGGTHGCSIELPDIWMTRGNISIKVDNKNNTMREGYNVATSDTDLDQEAGYWKGGTFVSLKGEAWTLVSGEIEDSDRGKLIVKEHKGTKYYDLGTGENLYYRFAHKPDHGYITNHINTVDLPGEWYCGNGIMYFYPPEGADINNDFEIKQRQLVIDLRDRKFVTLKNINTIGGGTTISGDLSEGNVIDGCNMKWISHYTKLIDQSGNFIDPDETETQRDNSITCGEVGVAISGKNNAFINSTIDFSAASGLYLMGRDHYVYNNIISNVSYAGGYPGAVSFGRMLYEDPLGYYGGFVVRHNTMYNSGRALFNAGGYSVADMEGKYAPYVANEFAYNRLYNGDITSRDTGVTYQYGYTGGNDKRRTQLHHNYVSDIVYYDRRFDSYDADNNPDGIGTGNSHIYQDGFTANQDTYCNLTFQTLEETKDVSGGTWEQLQPWTQVRQRNNSDLGYFPGGLEALKSNHFPGGKPFFAGSFDDGRERFMMNYNNLQAGIKPYIPDTSATVKSSWDFADVKIENDGYTLLTVDYVRDTNEASIFSASATLTDSDGNIRAEVTVPVSATGDEKLKTAEIPVPTKEAGVYDINITFDNEDSKVLRLRTSEGSPEMERIFAPDVIYGGSYDDYIEGTSTGEIYPLSKNINNSEQALLENRYYSMHNTWTHTAIYKDRDFDEDCDYLDIVVGTGSPYDGQTLEIYVDSLKSNPVAKMTVESTGWAATPRTIKLDSTISKGKHTFYVKFDGVGKCSDVYAFDFYNSANRSKGNEVE